MNRIKLTRQEIEKLINDNYGNAKIKWDEAHNAYIDVKYEKEKPKKKLKKETEKETEKHGN